jgi:dienelactone hydrolase
MQLFNLNKCVAFLILAVAAQICVAQTVNPATEVLAKDMREEIVRIDVTVKDLYNKQETKPVAITIYRPVGVGPYPLVVFNHGRAVSEKRAAQGRSRPEHLARYFVAKGFVVLAPTRIGYWETYGSFDPEDSGNCSNMRVAPMSIVASDQVLASVEFAKSLPYVDTSRWIVAGQSVGGLATVATVGRNPKGLIGGINFSGGTGGNPDKTPGNPCGVAQISSYWGSIAKNSPIPMLWLYWQNDKFWGEKFPRDWYEKWIDGGGVADFKMFPPVGDDGHAGLNTDMNTWLPVVDDYLNKLGFNKSAIVGKSEKSGFAELTNLAKVPISDSSIENFYTKFLASKHPRAFAIGERGASGFASGDYATGKAIGFCQRSGQVCKLYAVDDEVVWR